MGHVELSQVLNMGGSEHTLVTTDGELIPYRLDGCSEPDAPLIILSNPSMVNYSIWDEFMLAFLDQPQNKKYRLLRYDSRGRSSKGGEKTLTLDILTADIITLLDTLRVPKAAAMAGMSLGGMTVLNLALKHPERVSTVLPCDFFPKSPPDNRNNWERRIAIAQNDPKSPRGADRARLVGQDFAQVTVERWLSPKSLDGRMKESKLATLQRIVHDNNLEGLMSIVDAISSYDLTRSTKEATVPAAFVAGADDYPVIPGMKELATNYGNGSELHIILEAGHLPAVEHPETLARILTNLLEANAGSWDSK